MTVARKRRSEMKDVVGEFPKSKRRKIDHVEGASVKRGPHQTSLLLYGPKTFVLVSRLTMGEGRGTYFLHHSELQTMRRNCWISFQVIEFYINLMISESKSRHRLFYISGKLMSDLFNGVGSEIKENRLMLDVDVDQYDGALSFVHVSHNHWMLVYINALSGQLSLLDPLYPLHEQEESDEMAKRFGNFLRVRDLFLPALTATKWSCIKWQGRKVDHNLQLDSTSCGVFVLKFADQLIRGFPALPSRQLQVESGEEKVWKVRERMVEEMEMGGDDKKTYCSMCGSKNRTGNVKMIECVRCGRRFHPGCIITRDSSTTTRSHNWIGPICRNLSSHCRC